MTICQSAYDKRQVAVLDPESCEFRRLKLGNLKRSDFEELKIPVFQRTFDVYAPTDETDDKTDDKSLFNSEGANSEKGSTSSASTRHHHSIVTRSTQDTQGKSLVTRLRYDKLGLIANFQRIVSEKHRVLYIGEIKPSYY